MSDQSQSSVTTTEEDGWLRLTTSIERPDLDVVTRAKLGLLYLETGFGHVHYDAANARVRIVASLPAMNGMPKDDVLAEASEHVMAVRQRVITGEGDVRAAKGDVDAPTLRDVARAAGRALALVPEKGSFVGGLREPKSGVECALRLHTPMPGIFAADAWMLPPTRSEPDVALFDRLDAVNAALPAGATLLVPGESFVVYRWSCPYRWLSLEQLEAPALAYTALAAFMRWRSS